MSVRRLAEDAVQPAAFAFSAENENWARNKLKDFPEGREASGVIPLLMRAQEQEGWVTKPAIEHIAGMLDMPLIRVLEVATFYTQFQLAPVGKRAHIQVCGTTPCMLRGAGDIIDVCKRRISPNQFETTEDGSLSWEEVECQGACVNAPMVMVFKDSYEDLTPERMEEIIDAFDAGNGASVPVGPQIDRIFAAPEGGPTSLLEDPEAALQKPKSRGKKSEKAEPQPATDAARPASHVTMTSPAIDTPVNKAKSRTAKKAASESRAEAGTPSPKRRAAKLADNVEKNNVEPADLRQPKPEELDGAPGAAAKREPASKSKAAVKEVRTSDLNEADRPASIKKPANPDDLKLISGVGPKIEGILNNLGIYTFAQIASWKKKEREWVDGYLRFKGRIDRDEWVKQAKALAKGGRDEYIRVFGKEPR